MENVLKSSMKRKAVLKRLERTGKLRKEFFFPSKKGLILHKKKTITRKKIDYLPKSSQPKIPLEFNAAWTAKVRRVRRYAAQGSQWAVGSTGEITWNVVDWSLQLSDDAVKRTLANAFRIWAEVCPLVFRWVDSPTVADIAVKFVTGKER